jgi:hypothetical protein
MIGNEFKTNVLLPVWIWEKARDKDELKTLILEYMSPRYPNYVVKSVRDHMAICERGD